MISLVGNTPMIQLNNIPKSQGFKCKIYAKCEFMNPTGSATDRTVKHMFQTAPSNLVTKKGDVIIGGPGDICLSVAWMSALGDLKPTVILEKSCPSEKLDLITALGGRIVPRPVPKDDTPLSTAPGSLHSLTDEVLQSVPRHLHLKAGITPSSLVCHYKTTGIEIKSQIGGKIDMLVCAAEAGGMIFGISMQLLEQDLEHPETLGGQPGQSHETLNFTSIGVDLRDNHFCESKQNEFDLPEWSDTTFESTSLTQTAYKNNSVTKWYKASDADSYFMSRRLAREEGLMVGPGAGAVLSVALTAIDEFGLKENPDAVIVIVLNGSLWKGPRDFISNSWMLERNHFEAKRMESLYWWWDMPVSNIKMSPTVLIPVTTTVEITLNVLEKSEGARGIVLDSLEEPLGIVVLESLKSLVEKKLITPSDSLLGAYSSSFKKIDCNASISELHPALQEVTYGLIIQKSLTLTDEDDSPKQIEVVTGLVDQGDMTKFLLEIEKHHEDNYKIVLSDGIPSCDWFRKPINLDEENKNGNK